MNAPYPGKYAFVLLYVKYIFSVFPTLLLLPAFRVRFFRAFAIILPVFFANGLAYAHKYTSPGPGKTAGAVKVAASLYTINGTVYNDANGLSDNIVNGTGYNAGNLFANLVDNSGNVYATTPVAAGAYAFTNVTGGVYTVILTTSAQTTGNPLSAAALPSGYISTGEYLDPGPGNTAGNDGTVNSKLQLGVVSGNINGANLGITAAGYIYVHKKTLDESSSTDFTFSVSGGAASVANFNLNDNPTQTPLKDIGSSQSGRLWAVSNSNVLYYRDMGSAAWVQTTITNAYRVDGGAAKTAYVVTTDGNVIYFDGTTSTTIGTPLEYGNSYAWDIGSTWDGQPYLVNWTGYIYRYSGSGTTWTLFNNSRIYDKIDGNPATGAVVVSGYQAPYDIYSFTSAGVETSLGRPAVAYAGYSAFDVAVDGSGKIYSSFYNSTTGVEAPFQWQNGTTWGAADRTGSFSEALTGGPGGQVWMLMNSGSPFGNIYSRSFDGSAPLWIDDERVHTSPTNSNSEMIAVIPGTYTLNETVPSGWDLQHIELYDPTSNSTFSVAGNNATLTVAAGETVNAIFVNGVVNPFSMTTSCTNLYLEDFGSGVAGSFGSPLAGQTSYHYMNDDMDSREGYYKVAGSAQVLYSGAPALFDHTSGNGTGRMMLVDAGFTKGEFFRRRFTGLAPGATYNFSAWVASILGGYVPPDVIFQVVDPTNYNVLATFDTGPINTASTWYQYTLSFTATATSIDLVLVNNAPGGGGNDIALDDISFSMVPVSTPISTISNTACLSPTAGHITVTTPVGPYYEYSLDGTNFQSSPSFSSLVAGNYTVYARFAGTTGCVATKTEIVKAAVCGTVHDDANGLNLTPANTIDGSGTNAGGVNVVLYDKTTGAVESFAAVAADGSFSVLGTPGHNFDVYLTTSTVSPGQTAIPGTTVPSNWAYTGEYFGTGAGSDTSPDGILSIGTVNTVTTNIHLGVEQLPQSDPKVQAINQPAPNQLITLNGAGSNPTYFTGSDPEDHPGSATLSAKTVAITSLPNYGQLWYSGSQVTGPVTIPNFNPSLVQFKATGVGYTSTSFGYAYVDLAGKQDPTPATYTLTWSNPLPLVLESFIATKQGCDKIELDWKTGDAISFSHFSVESSVDGLNFQPIATVLYSSSVADYSYKETNTGNGRYYYRLKMIDDDGSSRYSPIVSVVIGCQEKAISVHPNPVKSSFTVAGLTGSEQLQLYGVNGQLLTGKKATGLHEEFQLDKYPPGIYVLVVVGENNKRLSAIKINKTN